MLKLCPIKQARYRVSSSSKRSYRTHPRWSISHLVKFVRDLAWRSWALDPLQKGTPLLSRNVLDWALWSSSLTLTSNNGTMNRSRCQTTWCTRWVPHRHHHMCKEACNSAWLGRLQYSPGDGFRSLTQRFLIRRWPEQRPQCIPGPITFLLLLVSSLMTVPACRSRPFPRNSKTEWERRPLPGLEQLAERASRDGGVVEGASRNCEQIGGVNSGSVNALIDWFTRAI